jgi:hypothetical protein
VSFLQPVQTKLIAGPLRRDGWRAVVRDGRSDRWRCDCYRPHASQQAAIACGHTALSQRGSGFYPGRDYMNEWLPVPTTTEAQQELVTTLRANLTMTVVEAQSTLEQMLALIIADEGYEQVREHQGAAEGIRFIFREMREIREQAEKVFLAGEWRIGQALLMEEQATGGEAYHQTPAPGTRSPEKRVPSVAEKVGNRTYGWRLKQIAPLPIEGLNSVIRELHIDNKEATLTGVVKVLRAEESAMRRLDSLTAPALHAEKDYRVGDCRAVLSDIENDSVALILTDPPYGGTAEPLYEWLAEFAARVLVPGGSLVCYTGQSLLDRDMRIFGEHLKYWWLAMMQHDNSQRLPGKFVIVNQKPILWYVKEYRRGRTLVPDLVNSKRDKSKHDWSQGTGGVSQWIDCLTDPRELVVDPFAGTGMWGDITAEMGRRWIGADIAFGGTTTTMAEEIHEEEVESE